MKQKIIIPIISLISFSLFYIYGGIGFDREFNDSTIFMKHKPKAQLFFKSIVGESDKKGGENEAVYKDFFEKNRKSGLYNLIIFLFFQTGITTLLIITFILLKKMKIFSIDLKTILLSVFYGIFIKFSIYAISWNVWGLGTSLSYIPLLFVMLIFDIIVFKAQSNVMITENEI